ncbi:MAG: DUF4399 domain-containing protein [Gammaproteobacteria bacterium]|nr:DUF4399 domain-containing protein [Gammaproteobacteria bacterium]
MNKLNSTIILSVFLSVLLITKLWAHGVPHSAKAFIITPKNNERVSSPVTIKFGIKDFLIAPAGVNKHKAGHYHLLIDLQKPIDLDKPIPRDKHHLHFDQGETEATIKLAPGKHTLQLIVADEEHEPFEQLISKPINIDVSQ